MNKKQENKNKNKSRNHSWEKEYYRVQRYDRIRFLREGYKQAIFEKRGSAFFLYKKGVNTRKVYLVAVVDYPRGSALLLFRVKCISVLLKSV